MRYDPLTSLKKRTIDRSPKGATRTFVASELAHNVAGPNSPRIHPPKKSFLFQGRNAKANTVFPAATAMYCLPFTA